MHHFQAAQPALLYLSPACVGSVSIVALVRGEWKDVWKWSDGDENEEQQEQAKEVDVDSLPDAKIDERYLKTPSKDNEVTTSAAEDDSWMQSEEKQPRRRKSAATSTGKKKK